MRLGKEVKDKEEEEVDREKKGTVLYRTGSTHATLF